MRAPRPYSNPYAAGVALGLVLLASYVLAGRGLGASGAFATVAAEASQAVAPAAVAGNPYLAARLGSDGPLSDWLVVEMLGAVVGALASAALAGRLRPGVDRGPHVGARSRVTLAAGGGLAMGAGAVLARGCTSGLALSGGALLGVGSWLFVVAAFAAGYATMLVARRAWT